MAGLLQTLGFSTGFANGHYKYTSAVPSASCGFGYSLNWCVMILEIQCWGCLHLTFSLPSRRRRSRKRWESWQILWRWPPSIQRRWS